MAEDYLTFWTAVTRSGGARCLGCALWPEQRRRCEHVSAGVIDAHHVIPKRLLKTTFPHGAYVYEDGVVDRIPAPHRVFLAPNAEEVNGVRVVALDHILWDPRNGVPLGRWHHDEIEQRRLVLGLEALPKAVFEFADEFDLRWFLERGARAA